MWKNLWLAALRLKIKAFFPSKIWIKKDPSNDIAQQLDKNVVYFNDTGEEKKYSLNISVMHLGKILNTYNTFVSHDDYEILITQKSRKFTF